MFKRNIITVVCLLGMLSLAAQVTPSVTAGKKYYILDLNSSDTLDIWYDTVSWRTMNRVTNAPVDFYIIHYADGKAPDTVHGITGIIVNDLIVRAADNSWAFNDQKVKWDGKEFKMKDRYGRKVKWDQGDLKIKDWNNKYKSEKDDDAKYKEEWDKIKWKEDETKVEVGTQKTKVKDQQ